VYTEGPTLEFKTDLPWGHLALVGNERMKGTSPLLVPGPVSGNYWLLASGRGVEDQRGRIRIRLDEEGPTIASYGRPGFTETFLRATLYPGHAQYRALERRKGLVMIGAATASLTLTVLAQRDLWDAESSRDAASRAFDQSGTVEQKLLLQDALIDATEDVSFYEQRRDMFLRATAVCWGISYLDALFFRPAFNVRQADASSVTLGMQPKTRLDATLRSLVFPGLGQLYNSEPRKAGWMAAAGLAAGGWLLYRQDLYNEAISDLNKIDGRIGGATSVPEREALEAARAIQYGEVDDRYQERNVAVVLLAGAWGVAAIDAFYSHGKKWGNRTVRSSSGAFGLRADPLQGTVSARLEF
jgi:hypothetical protein